LVDDNADTRKIVAKMLRAYHYNVIEAADGQQALQLYKEHENSIDLLLTDVVMPNMTGHELAEVVFKVRPDQKVLYMSAYGPEILSREYGISTESFSVLQ